MGVAKASAQKKPQTGRINRLVSRAPLRLKRALALARTTIREDGSLAPIVAGGAWEQPAYERNVLTLYEVTRSGERARVMNKGQRGMRRGTRGRRGRRG